MSTETLMTEGLTISQPDASQPGDANTNGEAATTEQQTVATGSETTAGEATASAPAGEETAAGGEPAGDKTGEATESAPDSYADFTMPEGLTFDTEVGDELKAFAKEHGLTQTQAQAIADMGAKLVSKTLGANDQALADVRTAWADETKADAEIGGQRLQQTLANAQKAIKQFASPAMIDLLDGSGLGNHPEFVRAFAKIGAAISEDTIVSGSATSKSPASLDVAERLYPNQGQS